MATMSDQPDDAEDERFRVARLITREEWKRASETRKREYLSEIMHLIHSCFPEDHARYSLWLATKRPEVIVRHLLSDGYDLFL